MKNPKPFATEVDLCAAFIAALPKGWTPYAETAGFDILLVRAADGVQIGVEAKLKLNAHVVSQALEDGGYWRCDRPNPDFRAVLVPAADAGSFQRIADYIGFTVLMMSPSRDDGYGPSWKSKPSFYPGLPNENGFHDRDWHDWSPSSRCSLPEYVPDVAAGDSAPIQLTDWKIAALRIEATVEIRGHVTRADFAAHRIDHRRWMARENGWLRNEAGKLVPGPRFPNFKAQHPRVYAEIVADAEKWLPKSATDLLTAPA